MDNRDSVGLQCFTCTVLTRHQEKQTFSSNNYLSKEVEGYFKLNYRPLKLLTTKQLLTLQFSRFNEHRFANVSPEQ